jgi:hypothetical protein
MPINVTRTIYTVQNFLEWQQAGTLVLSPSFQRRSSWSPLAKSFLIDTVLKGLPMPIIFVRRRTDPKTLATQMEVVDGQQRLRTMLGFIDPSCLSDFDPTRDGFVVSKTHNPDFAGLAYQQLPTEAKMELLNYEFSVHVLGPDTRDADVLMIFSRMNSTGLSLNYQELRNAEFFGEFKETAYGLAREYLDNWRQWHLFNETAIARMEEVEFTSELIQMMLKDVTAKNKTSLDKLYRDNDVSFIQRPVIEERFRYTMDKIGEVFGAVLPKTEFTKITLFYPLFGYVYDVAYGLGSELKWSKPKRVPPQLRERLLEASRKIKAQELDEVTAGAVAKRTTHSSSRRVVMAFIKGECANGQGS